VIKSDKWIRRMARSQDDRAVRASQVREVAGQKIVSYGTSSYGYDIRCSNEFKLFTNLNSTIVDQEFRRQVLRRLRGDGAYPAELVALARTVEYFRIRATCSRFV
jgi:dCTP deaminase